jgi:hypothetical protein
VVEAGIDLQGALGSFYSLLRPRSDLLIHPVSEPLPETIAFCATYLVLLVMSPVESEHSTVTGVTKSPISLDIISRFNLHDKLPYLEGIHHQTCVVRTRLREVMWGFRGSTTTQEIGTR